MAWDEELDRLTRFVHEVLGQEQVDMAVTRAMAAVARDNAHAEDPLDGAVTSAVGAIVPEEAYCEALRVELRKLARPN
jgi:hypothetical protein